MIRRKQLANANMTFDNDISNDSCTPALTVRMDEIQRGRDHGEVLPVDDFMVSNPQTCRKVLQQLSMKVGALNEKVKATSLGSLTAQGRQDSIQISSFYYNGQVSAINLHSILLITRSPKLML